MKERPIDFLALLNREYRWPKKGDRLLRRSDNWHSGVGFTDDTIARHVFMWDGYMRAGAALVEIAKEAGVDRNLLIYPILFTYRHAIELAMKWIVAQYGRYADVELTELDHDLWQLWKKCRAVVELGPDDEATPVVEQIIKDFHELDKTALAFRYAQNRNGILIALPDGLIDLENIRDVMEGVAGFFDGADGLLGDYASAAP